MNYRRTVGFIIILTVILFQAFMTATYANDCLFDHGDGSPLSPFMIATAEDLDNMRNCLGNGHADKHFRLMNDIDLNAYLAPGGAGYEQWDDAGWLPIGDANNRFEGTFDGQGYEISGLFIDRSGGDIGLFGAIGDSGSVKNMNVTGSIIKAEYATFVGGLTGRNYGQIDNVSVELTEGIRANLVNGVGGLAGFNNGEIRNSFAGSDVIGGENEVGGLVGRNASNNVSIIGVIHNSYATGDVSGKNRVGGLVGNASGIIRYAYATGRVNGQDQVGGLLGHSFRIHISASYATGDVIGDNRVGGLVGDVDGDNVRSSVRNSFAKGEVTSTSGGSRIGGLIGSNLSADVENSYATGRVIPNGATDVGGLVGLITDSSFSGSTVYSFYDRDTSLQNDTGNGIPLSTEAMQNRSTFEDVGWDFEWIWAIDSGEYPHLMPRFTVTYRADDSDGGESKVEQIHSRGSTVTVIDAGHLSRTGYSFAGWNTKPDGNGDTYHPEDTAKNSFLMGAEDMTLYVLWEPNIYEVLFHPQGGTVEPESQMKQFDALYGKGIDGNKKEELPIPTRTGYTFAGWYFNEEGTGDKVTNDTLVSKAYDHELFAQWLSGNARLSSLEVRDDEGHLIPFEPTFHEAVTTYRASVSHDVYGISVTATASHDTSTLQLNGQKMASGVTSEVYGLHEGENLFTIKVRAADGTEQEYTLTVHQEAESRPPVSGGGSRRISTPANDSHRISPNGGEISLDGIHIHFPAGVWDRVLYVTVEVVRNVSNLPIGPEQQFVSPVIRLTKDQEGDFRQAVTMTMSFDTAKVDEETHGVSLFWLDKEAEEWIELSHIEVDWENGTVSGMIDHFTPFAVLATELEQEERTEKDGPTEPVRDLHLTDISGHWAEEEIRRLISLGAINGYPDGCFRPNEQITRAEFTSILVKALELEMDQHRGQVFADTEQHWAKEAIATAQAYGIVTGYDELTFGVNDPITREQMATMMLRVLQLEHQQLEVPMIGEEHLFTDQEAIADWAFEAVMTLLAQGLMDGYPDGSFRPQSEATRGEAVVITSRLLKQTMKTIDQQ